MVSTRYGYGQESYEIKRVRDQTLSAPDLELVLKVLFSKSHIQQPVLTFLS
jgi:hypothetical protein